MKFVCVFLFLLSLHPTGAGALREQREVSQQRLLLKRASLGARDAVEWSVGVWEVVLPTSPKVYLSLLAFFLLAVHVSGVWVYFGLFLFAFSREPHCEDTVYFLVFFSFANVPSHNPKRRPSNAVIKTS